MEDQDDFFPQDEQEIRDQIDDEIVNHEDATGHARRLPSAAKSPISYFAPGSEDIDLK
jgi:hypothetical protein